MHREAPLEVDPVAVEGLLDRVRAAVPLIAERAFDAERQRKPDDDVIDGSGASVHFLDHELQRTLRDVQMISAHTVFDVDLVAEQCGRALLEVDVPLHR